MLGAIYALIALALTLIFAFLTGTFMTLPFAWIPRGRRERYTVYATQTFGWLVTRVALLARVRVVGSTRLLAGRGYLIICNHRSWLDPMVIAGYLRANGLAKRQVLYFPLIGLYGWLAGTLFVNRGLISDRHRARLEARGMLQSGHRLFIFPEGTRSRTGRLNDKVHLGLVKDCFAAGIAVVPCALRGTERVIPVPSTRAFPFREVVLDVGEPMDPAGFADADGFSKAAWAEVRRRLE